MEIVLLIAGLAFAGVGAYLLYDTWRFRKIAVETRGTVVAIEKSKYVSKKRGAGASYRPVIEYTWHGRPHRFTSRVGSSAITHAIGQRVAVLVAPDDAVNARLKSRVAPVLGLIFLCVGIGTSILFFHIFEPSPFSLTMAAVVVLMLAIQAYRRLRRLGIDSIEDLASLKARGSALADAGRDRELMTDTAAVKQEVRGQSRQLRWAGPLLLVLGLGVCAGGAWLAQQRAAFLDIARTAEGAVISLAASPSTSNGSTTTTWYPVVRYTSAGGEAVTFRHDVGTSHPSWQRGEQVPVLYDPEDPQTAIIDEGWMNWFGPALMLVLGALFFLAGMAMIRRWQRLHDR